MEIDICKLTFKADFSLEKLFKLTDDILYNHKIAVNHEELNSVSPNAALKIFNSISSSDYSIEANKRRIDKITSLFFNPLKSYKSIADIDDHFLKLLLIENQNVLITLSKCKSVLRNNLTSDKLEFSRGIFQFTEELKKYKAHYRKQETYLFPLFKKVLPQYYPYINMTVLFHNDFKYLLIDLENIIRKENIDKKHFSRLIGKLYFRLHFSIYREELVFFPICQQYIHFDLRKYLSE